MKKFIYEDYINDINNISSDEDVDKINNDYGIILQYRLGDAWGMPDYSLFILDRDKDNIVSIGNKNEMKLETITQKELGDIKNFLIKNEILYDEDMIAVPAPILDGTSNNIMISFNDRFIEINSGNLWYWLEKELTDDTKTNDIVNVEYTKTIVDLLILLKNIMNKHNLKLHLYLDEDDQD